jgi:hypothetical protein
MSLSLSFGVMPLRLLKLLEMSSDSSSSGADDGTFTDADGPFLFILELKAKKRFILDGFFAAATDTGAVGALGGMLRRCRFHCGKKKKHRQK